MLHHFETSISRIPLPERFTYPFCYTPHPLCILAAEEVQRHLSAQTEWQQELAQGKMFGVLVVQVPSGNRQSPEYTTGYLAAFSGILAGRNNHPFFVPPVYDLLQPDGFFKQEEQQISAINHRIKEREEDADYLKAREEFAALQQEAEKELQHAKEALRQAKKLRDEQRKAMLSEEESIALVRESQYRKAEYKRLERRWMACIAEARQAVEAKEQEIEALKAERKQRSAALQQRLFGQFRLLNARGEVKDLCDIFRHTAHKTPPAGAGECAAPKLLQQAYLHGWKPIAMAEFWWGASPKMEIRQHGQYYPACKGKCEPILTHMLQGLEVEPNPLLLGSRQAAQQELEIIYEDPWLAVVCKPAGMLSVPGKEDALSLYDLMRRRYPDADSPLIVHRLDMATSGLLVIAKTKQAHEHLQQQFAVQTVKKRYIALLDGVLPENKSSDGSNPAAEHGTLSLPLCLNPMDRPRQMVDYERGKPALTDYEVLGRAAGCTRIAFHPRTGRTHQLRMHAAHPDGLDCPILGDELYGRKAERLYLHAEALEFIHPITGKKMSFCKRAEF